MLSILLAAIVFGPPGPIQHKTFADSVVHADIAYRIAPDKLYGSGEAALPPSIVTGTLDYTAHGRRYRYDLATILPIREHHIELPDSPADGCGAREALTRRGDYLVIEMVYAEKGCKPDVAVVEIATGIVARRATLDWNWSHRFDVAEPRLIATTGRVERVATLRLGGTSTTFSSPPKTVYVPWTFRVVHWMSDRSTQELTTYEAPAFGLDGTADPGADIAPMPGEVVSVGRFAQPIYPARETELIIRLDGDENRRYAALQPPSPPDLGPRVRYNQWFMIADQRAENGDLDGAVRAFEKLLDYAPDDTTRAQDAAIVTACRAYIPIAARKHLSNAAIAMLFSNGCKPPN